MTDTYFAYVHARPNGSIFYVGKGTRQRVTRFYGRNKHHQAIVAKYGRENILIGSFECSSETNAFDLEVGIIKCLRRSGVLLANNTNGGEGFSGGKHTDAAKKKIGDASRRKVISEDTRARMSEAQKKSMTPERRKKLSDIRKEAPTIQHAHAANKGRKLTPDQKRHLSAINTGKRLSDETRRKISAASKEHMRSAEARKHLSSVAREQMLRLWELRKAGAVSLPKSAKQTYVEPSNE